VVDSPAVGRVDIHHPEVGIHLSVPDSRVAEQTFYSNFFFLKIKLLNGTKKKTKLEVLNSCRTMAAYGTGTGTLN
jgi:hypothetical protein